MEIIKERSAQLKENRSDFQPYSLKCATKEQDDNASSAKVKEAKRYLENTQTKVGTVP